MKIQEQEDMKVLCKHVYKTKKEAAERYKPEK